MSGSTLGNTNRPRRPSNRSRNLWSLGLITLFLWASLTNNVDFADVLKLPGGVLTVISEMYFQGGPDLSWVSKGLVAMLESLQIAWIGTVIGAAISLPLGFLGAKNVSSGLVSNIVRVVLNAIRAFPELVLAIAIFIPMVGLGPVAGALALGIHSAGTLGKLTAEAIESIDSGPVEAARATGAGSFQVQRWGVMPQVLPELIGFWLYRFEINIRAAAILGIVGAGGIGFLLNQTITFGAFPQAGTLVLIVIVVTILIDTISGGIRRRIIEGAEVRSVPDADLISDPNLAGR